MRFLVIGGAGNMGKRYSAILRYLKIDFDVCDPMIGKPYHIFKMKDYSHVIIATPTDSHFYYLQILSEHTHLKVLCEKPIAKRFEELNSILSIDKHFLKNLHLVNNYEYAYAMSKTINSDSLDDTDTVYNFYNTGNDGLLWDCVQLAYMAVGKISFLNNSPVWECKINGRMIDKDTIDRSYLKMVLYFAEGALIQWDIERIIRVHKFLWNENEKLKQKFISDNHGQHWHSSKNDIEALSGESAATLW